MFTPNIFNKDFDSHGGKTFRIGLFIKDSEQVLKVILFEHPIKLVCNNFYSIDFIIIIIDE
jgi:hypothetical protein